MKRILLAAAAALAVVIFGVEIVESASGRSNPASVKASSQTVRQASPTTPIRVVQAPVQAVRPKPVSPVTVARKPAKKASDATPITVKPSADPVATRKVEARSTPMAVTAPKPTPTPAPVATPVSERPAPAAAPSPAPTPARALPAHQLRGLWVDAFGPGFKTPAEADRLVADAKSLGINALFPQVVKRGDCYCLKSAAPATVDPDVPVGFDALDYLIGKAHASGIQVHAWVIASAIARTEGVLPAGHVLEAHGPDAAPADQWLTIRNDGAVTAGKDYVLDPGNPDAAAYLTQVAASIAEAYPVDGVQLDRIRYPDDPANAPVWGYNPTSLARFQADTDRSDVPEPWDEAWMAWRRDRVTDLVRSVSDAVKAARPTAWLSVATITYGSGPGNLAEFQNSRTYREVLQDWPAWTAAGIVDLNILMNYKRESDSAQAAAFDAWNRFAVANKGSGHVAAGAAIYLNTPEGSLSQARRALSTPGLDGWVAYSYRTPDVATYQSGAAGGEALARLSTLLAGHQGPLSGIVSWLATPTNR